MVEDGAIERIRSHGEPPCGALVTVAGPGVAAGVVMREDQAFAAMLTDDEEPRPRARFVA